MTAWVDGELEILKSWIRDREAIRKAKESGAPKPWTADPLLRDYRWCNVRRMDDRVSRALFEHWYSRNGDRLSSLKRALFARLFNWPESLDAIVDNPDNARELLLSRAQQGRKVFGGAYVIPGVPGRGKVDSICDLIDYIGSRERFVMRSSMRETWFELTKFDGIGSFLAGQVVADLAHLPDGRQWEDADRWAPLGPGSARGINRLRGLPKDRSVLQADFDRLLPELTAVLRPHIEEIWTDRQLQAMDIQNCLCEFDKTRRLQMKEGKVRARYDGKQEDAGLDAQQRLFA